MRDRAQRRELLDRLVRGSVLAEADRVVGVDIDRVLLHQRREPNRRAHVVREDQERRAVRDQRLAERHAVHHRAHAVLAHAEVHVAPLVAARLEVARALDDRVRRRRQIGRAAHQRRHALGDRVEHLARRLARRHPLAGREDRDVGVPPLGQFAREPALELFRLVGIVLRVGLERRVPRGLQLGALRDRLAEVRERILGDVERRLKRPAEVLLGELQLLCAERLAVRLGRVLPVRAAEADVRARHDERRALGLALRLGERVLDLGQAVAVDALDVPVVAVEARRRVLGVGDVGRPLDRDVVVVVEDDELAELEVAGERGGLARDALHQVAVARDRVREVVDDRVAVAVEARREVRLRYRHADRVREALTERTGRGLDARRQPVLRVARRERVPLTELLELLERQVVAGQVQKRVEEHRAVSGREDEPVTVRPRRVLGVVVEELRPEDVGHRGRAHRHARVAGVRLLNPVGRKHADRIDAELVEVGVVRGLGT